MCHRHALFASLLTLCVACSSADAPRPTEARRGTVSPAPPSYSLSSQPVFRGDLWNDGLAEVNRYDATRLRYGELRRFPLTLINVKEDLDLETMVKSDDPSAGPTLGVIKSHLFYDMPTQNYPYHFAASTFIDRTHPYRLRKFTGTSSEWCGITTRVLRPWTSPPTLEYRSYFGGEGEGVSPLEWPENGFTEEQLLISLRALAFRDGLEAQVNVLSRQTDSHAGPPSWREGRLRVSGPGPVENVEGVAIDAWHVEISLPGQERLVYDFAVEAPHILIRHEAPDGLTMRLRESRRWAYWSL